MNPTPELQKEASLGFGVMLTRKLKVSIFCTMCPRMHITINILKYIIYLNIYININILKHPYTLRKVRTNLCNAAL